MSILTMNMCNYEVKQADSPTTEYNDEILCSGWVPTLAQQQSLSLDWENKPSIPEDLVNVDAEVFLRKMYTNQR